MGGWEPGGEGWSGEVEEWPLVDELTSLCALPALQRKKKG